MPFLSQPQCTSCVRIQFSPEPLECPPKCNTGIKWHIKHDTERYQKYKRLFVMAWDSFEKAGIHTAISSKERLWKVIQGQAFPGEQTAEQNMFELMYVLAWFPLSPPALHAVSPPSLGPSHTGPLGVSEHAGHTSSWGVCHCSSLCLLLPDIHVTYFSHLVLLKWHFLSEDCLDFPIKDGNTHSHPPLSWFPFSFFFFYNIYKLLPY